MYFLSGFMENIYLEGDQVILLSVVEQLHLPFLAGMYSKLFFIITGLGVGKGEEFEGSWFGCANRAVNKIKTVVRH